MNLTDEEFDIIIKALQVSGVSTKLLIKLESFRRMDEQLKKHVEAFAGNVTDEQLTQLFYTLKSGEVVRYNDNKFYTSDGKPKLCVVGDIIDVSWENIPKAEPVRSPATPKPKIKPA